MVVKSEPAGDWDCDGRFWRRRYASYDEYLRHQRGTPLRFLKGARPDRPLPIRAYWIVRRLLWRARREHI